MDNIIVIGKWSFEIIENIIDIEKCMKFDPKNTGI